MPDRTAHYLLTKPLPEEYYSIDDFNGNCDKLDAALKEVSDRAETALASLPGLKRIQYPGGTSSLTHTFTAPRTTAYLVECVGGGGGCSAGTGYTGNFGGGGAYVKTLVQLTKGQQVTCTVGRLGPSSPVPAAGGATSFGTFCSAPGGYTDVGAGSGSNTPESGDFRLAGKPFFIEKNQSGSVSGFSGSSPYGNANTALALNNTSALATPPSASGYGAGSMSIGATVYPGSGGYMAILWVE